MLVICYVISYMLLKGLKRKENDENSHRPLFSSLLFAADQSNVALWHHETAYYIIFTDCPHKIFNNSKIVHGCFPTTVNSIIITHLSFTASSLTGK